MIENFETRETSIYRRSVLSPVCVSFRLIPRNTGGNKPVEQKLRKSASESGTDDGSSVVQVACWARLLTRERHLEVGRQMRARRRRRRI